MIKSSINIPQWMSHFTLFDSFPSSATHIFSAGQVKSREPFIKPTAPRTNTATTLQFVSSDSGLTNSIVNLVTNHKKSTNTVCHESVIYFEDTEICGSWVTSYVWSVSWIHYKYINSVSLRWKWPAGGDEWDIGCACAAGTSLFANISANVSASNLLMSLLTCRLSSNNMS